MKVLPKKIPLNPTKGRQKEMMVERDGVEKNKKNLKKAFYKWSSISWVMIRGWMQSGIELRHALGMKRTVTAVKLDFLTAIDEE